MDIYHDHGWERDEVPECSECQCFERKMSNLQDYFEELVVHLEGKATDKDQCFMNLLEEIASILDVEFDYDRIEARYNNANI